MIPFSRFTLPNGLRVIHHHDPHTPMVAVNLLYNVGARDEEPHLTGMAHLFEHLMFGGSVNVPDFDAAIEAVGGRTNAWTSSDYTNFYDILPAVNAETAFWLESDRMLSLAFSPRSLEVQRKVVSEEFKQVCPNQPYGDQMHYLRPMLYTAHPYGHPAIGKEISHIERVSLPDVRRFFYSHYAPNNAVLAVAGNITAERVRELAERWFGPIPRRDIAPRLYPAEPEHTGPTKATVTGRVPQVLVTVAYPMPGYADPDYVTCDIITDLLAAGRSARFHRELVMKEPLFTHADASISGSDEPGFLMLNGMLSATDDASIDRALELLTAEASRLATEGVTDYELARAVNRYESNSIISSMNYLSKARELAMAEMHGEDINDIIPRYRAVTPADIKRVASRILTPTRSATLIYKPA